VGDELPLLDGGAGAWTDLLVDLAIVPIAPRLHVRDEGVVRVGQSTYAFARGPLRATQVHVEVDYGDARLSRHASWSGDARDFRERIAPARTFGFAHEMGDLALRGLARHAAPESVVLVTPNAILTSGRPFDADEPARHKLLDLIGDLFLYGGPPLGVVRATRPGHSATHEAMRVALERGLVARA
jgi:UDP-3-O-[3-hydroxymyristoyl] N-acetylglucosamine deacetylase